MKRLSLMVAGGLIVVLSASSVFAGIGDRQKNQRARITQGVKNGELTRHEAKKLIREQRHIKRMKMRAKADGTITAKERWRIQKAQDRASRHIFLLKHNNRTRY
jgi:uncharacterized membrane protein YebE (DUF533 family)